MKLTRKQAIFLLGSSAVLLVAAGAFWGSASARSSVRGWLLKELTEDATTDDHDAEEAADAAAAPQPQPQPEKPAYDPTKPSGLVEATKQGAFGGDDDADYEPNPEMQAVMDAREKKLRAEAKAYRPRRSAQGQDSKVPGKELEPFPGVKVQVRDYGHK